MAGELGLGDTSMTQQYVHTNLVYQNSIAYLEDRETRLVCRGEWIGAGRHVNEPTVCAHKP